MLQQLYTVHGDNLTGTPWPIYPRPQMKRDSYLNLNGEWEFGLSPKGYDQTIRLPFCPESILSGVHTHYPEGSSLFYRRYVTLPENFCAGRLLLHIGAADQTARVYINGHIAGDHQSIGSFCVDVTDHWQEGENEIVILCRDDLKDLSFPCGKQTMKRGGMWYTPVSGIWQTVWMESVPQVHIEKLKIENQGYSVTVSTIPALEGKVTVSGLDEFPLVGGSVTITPEEPHLWSPEDPYLYEFTVECGTDRVESYFAIRSLEVKKIGKYPRLCLNGKPYFFHALLDQGYWPDGILTPAAPESYADDILAAKKLGFNTLRKHIKIEMEEFYYLCDKLGMIVFQDMVNNSNYRFFLDTAMPTVFPSFQKVCDKYFHRDPSRRTRFLEGMETTVEQLKNHPCICYWTIFNEGWGQFDSDNVFDRFIKLDDTRFIDTTSGWFRQKKSDVDSRHVYFRKVKVEADGVKPLVVSEFGGKAWRVEGHVFNPDKTYGYSICRNQDEMNDALVKLYMEEILPCVRKGLCGSVYTQLADVEDEINGLLTYDRKTEKILSERMLPVAEALQQAVQEK